MRERASRCDVNLVRDAAPHGVRAVAQRLHWLHSISGYSGCQHALTVDNPWPIVAAINVSRYSVNPKKST